MQLRVLAAQGQAPAGDLVALCVRPSSLMVIALFHARKKKTLFFTKAKPPAVPVLHRFASNNFLLLAQAPSNDFLSPPQAIPPGQLSQGSPQPSHAWQPTPGAAGHGSLGSRLGLGHKLCPPPLPRLAGQAERDRSQLASRRPEGPGDPPWSLGPEASVRASLLSRRRALPPASTGAPMQAAVAPVPWGLAEMFTTL